MPGIRFGLAFCEASGPRLVRTSGTDPGLVDLAARNALAVGCGHTFLIFLGNAYPVNVLGAVRQVPEVCQVYCATANPVEVIVAATARGRGVLGVVDGQPPLGVEGAGEAGARHELLRKIGYKLARACVPHGDINLAAWTGEVRLPAARVSPAENGP